MSSTSVDGLSPNLFFTRLLSIGTGLVDESWETFHFDNWDVHVKGSSEVFAFFLLKSSKAKRTAPLWLQLPRNLALDPAGQGQAVAITFSDSLLNFTITL